MTRALLLISLLMVAAPVAVAQERGLDARVSLDARSIYLGELLERLSEASGVRLAADERLAPISGYRLTVVLHDQPVRDVMDALVALYTQPPDRWHWLAERERGERVYRLQPSQSPEALAQRIERLAREAMRADYQDKLRLMALPPDQRAAAAKGHPSLESFLRAKEFGEMGMAIASGLPAEELEALISGALPKKELPLSVLTAKQMAWVREQRARFNFPEDQLPMRIDIQTRRTSAGHYALIVKIFGTPDAEVASSAGLSQRLADEAAALWSAGSAPDVPLPAPGVELDAELFRRSAEPGEFAAGIGRGARVNVLYDLPRRPRARSIPLQDGAIPDRLPALMERTRQLFLAKQHADGYLLLRHPEWDELDRAGVVPWGLVKSLRETADANAGYLDLPAWERIATLADEQRIVLAAEFPGARLHASGDLIRIFAIAAAMTEAEREQLASPAGIGWERMSPPTRELATQLWPQQAGPPLRLLRQWTPRAEDTPPRLHFLVQPGQVNAPVEWRMAPRVDPALPPPAR